MTLQETLTRLQNLGTEKMRAFNRKNGAHENQFGLKMGDIRKVAAKIKTNHELALALWETGNIDARLLAILVMKPKMLTADQLDNFIRSERFVQVADWLSAYIIKEHPDKEALRQRWINDPDPMAARAGWSLTAGRVAREPEGLDLPGLLDRIEDEMPLAPAEVQWTMNTTLARIGIHFPGLRERAIDIGERLGIYRDYPVSKGCTSPFAPIWIGAMVGRG
ncbi:DNA alkylation repair protein [Pedobacter sp. SYP-B3415]|uniref:DNA alkylation repair protein n=1 Tax=Pedobacter sp. SYP-B3415 TaxID=2496641 RepID=UPI00101CF4E5|nr:DNA alkylation repair protein [Pedobacter sp. SYP-B3415]